MHPLMRDIPEEFITPRLILRTPRHGDGRLLNRVIRETLPNLKPWFNWVQKTPRICDTELYLRRVRVAFYQRSHLNYLIVDRSTNAIVGNLNVFDISWSLGEFEFGYWCAKSHQGRGYITEAVRHLMAYLHKKHGGRRFVIGCQVGNERSVNVALRLGFELDVDARQSRPGANGEPVDYCIYVKVYE